jgi:fosfomycin resistance protein FosX
VIAALDLLAERGAWRDCLLYRKLSLNFARLEDRRQFARKSKQSPSLVCSASFEARKGSHFRMRGKRSASCDLSPRGASPSCDASKGALRARIMIQGLSHLTFIVHNLDKMSRIITDVLGGEEVYSSGEETFSTSREKFFVAGGIWIAIMEGESLPSRTYNHVAFKVSEDDLERARVAANRLGLDVRPPRPRVDGEGQSLYFHDHDNHLFELHTGTLEERLARYRKES